MFLQTMWTLRLLSVLAVLATVPVNGYPSGAPFRACRDMFPEGHKVDSRMDESPFTISLNKKVYLPGDTVRVTVSASSGTVMKGLFLQARRANCSHPSQDQPLGTFRMLPKEQHFKVMKCTSLNDSVTHKSNTPQTSAVFDWYAPSGGMGHLYMVATVVEQKQTFWTRVYSDIISDLNSLVPVDSVKPCDARVLLNTERTTEKSPSAASKMTATLPLLPAILVYCFCQWL